MKSLIRLKPAIRAFAGEAVIRVKIVRSLSEQVWRDFIDRHPQSNIFHAPEMYEVFSRAKGHAPAIWAALGEDERILALLLPVRVSVLGHPFQKLTSRSIAYGSVLCEPDDEGQKALTALLDDYKKSVKKGVLFTELRNLHDLGPVQPVLQSQGFAYDEFLNSRIDLKCTKEELMLRIGARTRKNIRRAWRNRNLAIEEVKQKAQVKISYGLLQKTYSRAGVFLADQSLFDAAFDILHPKKMLRILLVKAGDAFIATSIKLLFKETICGWYSGLDREKRRFNPNELLMWHILEWGIDHDYKTYDFGAIGKPHQKYGVRDFFLKFRGDLFCFGRNTCVHSPGLLCLSKIGYSLYQIMPVARPQRLSPED